MIPYSFVLLINYLSGIYFHDFHLSVTNIEFDKTEHTLEMSQRIFIDDLEKVLSKSNDLAIIDIIQDFDKDVTKTYIREYVLDHIDIAVNNKTMDLNYLGLKLDGDVVVVFIECKDVKKLESITVENTLFMESFSDQMNLVNILVNQNNKSMKLESGKPSDTFEY